jgi:hypothetical protein
LAPGEKRQLLFANDIGAAAPTPSWASPVMMHIVIGGSLNNIVNLRDRVRRKVGHFLYFAGTGAKKTRGCEGSIFFLLYSIFGTKSMKNSKIEKIQ